MWFSETFYMGGSERSFWKEWHWQWMMCWSQSRKRERWGSRQKLNWCKASWTWCMCRWEGSWCGGNPGCEKAGRVRYERQGQTTWGWVGLLLWVELYPPERYVDFLISVLVNMTSFGNRLFAITVNLRWGHCVLSHLVVSNSFVTPWTIVRQAPLSMGFSRQEY